MPSLQPFPRLRYRRAAVRIAYDDRTVSRVTHDQPSEDPSCRNTSMSQHPPLTPQKSRLPRSVAGLCRCMAQVADSASQEC
ncbi:unnamed protein product [Macrosiphum euphorbiae]|uniref:Uncharacterized protein n=1 Tax=Macrosiphum euphorbiae TaxID=13131 RepID=A0AAV0VYX2_9HEMI|nr:unnamed protein product [Macrosiphum euphorbiae]